jgi:hypothetical protein
MSQSGSNPNPNPKPQIDVNSSPESIAELRRESFFKVAGIAALCALISLLLGAAYFFGAPISAAENGPLENAQAIMIVLSCLFPLFYVTKISSRPQKVLLLVTSLLPFSFFFREVEIKDLDLHQALVFIGSGLPNQLLVVGLWVLVIVVMMWFRDGYLRLGFDFLFKEVTGYLLLLCLVLLLLAGVVEEVGAGQNAALFIEELMELLAYSLLLIAAINSGSASGRTQQGL